MQEQNKNEYKLLGLNIAYYRKVRGLSQSKKNKKVEKKYCKRKKPMI